MYFNNATKYFPESIVVISFHDAEKYQCLDIYRAFLGGQQTSSTHPIFQNEEVD